MNIRKNIRDLTRAEKRNYIKAVKAVKARISRFTGRNIYDEYVLWHSLASNRLDSSDLKGFRNASHRNRLEGFLAPGRAISIVRGGDFNRQLHILAHEWIGGDMRNVSISPNDPVFFLHHSNVDRLWAIWQEKNPSQGYQPTADGPEGHNLYDLMYPWDGKTVKLKARPADVLNCQKLGYTYA